jgi:hypothetical protein
MSVEKMIVGPGKTRGYLLPLAVKTVSLIAIYATYGLLQERIIKGHYVSVDEGRSEDTFTSPPLLVLCNRLLSLIAGLVLVQFQPASSYLPIASSSSPVRQTWNQILLARVAHLKPTSPLFYYALVAALNNAATLSQYASLSHLSFTTSTLGKSAKMVPVLIIGHLWYGKKYKLRQWTGAVIVILGIWGYLSSLPQTDIGKDGKKKDITTNWMGVLYLFSYLLFDGLTSTMQERLFGQEKAAEEQSTLVGITGGIIDQMVGLHPRSIHTVLLMFSYQIWVNVFSAIIAFCMLLMSPTATTLPSLKLALSSPTLQLHILMLSAAATSGLLILFHVIATYGALMAGLVMTIRQFFSIVCNAAWFGNITNIPLLGWAGIGFMAAGIWIKMDRQYDEPAKEKGSSELTRSSRVRSFAQQYLLPVFVCPVVFMLLRVLGHAV